MQPQLAARRRRFGQPQPPLVIVKRGGRSRRGRPSLRTPKRIRCHGLSPSHAKAEGSSTDAHSGTRTAFRYRRPERGRAREPVRPSRGADRRPGSEWTCAPRLQSSGSTPPHSRRILLRAARECHRRGQGSPAVSPAVRSHAAPPRSPRPVRRRAWNETRAAPAAVSRSHP